MIFKDILDNTLKKHNMYLNFYQTYDGTSLSKFLPKDVFEEIKDIENRIEIFIPKKDDLILVKDSLNDDYLERKFISFEDGGVLCSNLWRQEKSCLWMFFKELK